MHRVRVVGAQLYQQIPVRPGRLGKVVGKHRHGLQLGGFAIREPEPPVEQARTNGDRHRQSIRFDHRAQYRTVGGGLTDAQVRRGAAIA
ncbi:Uncharacterised protein [Mycobacteroides abscessus subsp. abscessus]|nr:Uncharacterised protein [Mycobacteroides abscessus subsp. abscessus]